MIVLCSLRKTFYSHSASLLSTQEYKWVPVNVRETWQNDWGVTCDGLASHPGGVAIIILFLYYYTPSRFMLQNPRETPTPGSCEPLGVDLTCHRSVVTAYDLYISQIEGMLC